MRKITIALSLITLVVAIGCNTNNEQTVSSEQVNTSEVEEQNVDGENNEEVVADNTEEELKLEDYDYKTDPDTVVVNITSENVGEYFDLIVVKDKTGQSEGKYSVRTHSLMYDKGYVCVGLYYANCDFYNGAYQQDGKLYDYHDILGEDEKTGGTGSPFNYSVCWMLETEELAQEYAAKGINYYKPTFAYKDATIYYQKIEDVKFGYTMENGKRIVNGAEVRDSAYDTDNPF